MPSPCDNPMTARDLPELLPCPGCGEDRTRVIGGPGTKGGPQYWVGCDVCRWRTWGNTEAEAIAAWNTRAALAGAGAVAPVAWMLISGATGQTLPYPTEEPYRRDAKLIGGQCRPPIYGDTHPAPVAVGVDEAKTSGWPNPFDEKTMM